MISVNRKICIFLILGFAILGSSACANIPKDPTATPTLSDEEKLEFFKQTAAGRFPAPPPAPPPAAPPPPAFPPGGDDPADPADRDRTAPPVPERRA